MYILALPAGGNGSQVYIDIRMKHSMGRLFRTKYAVQYNLIHNGYFTTYMQYNTTLESVALCLDFKYSISFTVVASPSIDE